ncbi:MAG: hypothetical protein ACUVXA_02335 [Candidatus Jordarchaeum sp.]|uniref:flagellar biosynthesis protein FlhF n=1 Tax=Candidatus Jordarchaeum sp. TaxID=2823881 RepID=UPI004049D6B4
MQIKRFEGKDIKEVLKQVREEFGPDAIILSTKRIKPPYEKLNIISSPLVEIIAAVDRDQSNKVIFQTSSVLPSKNQKDSFNEKEEDFFIKEILSLGLHRDFINNLLEEIRFSNKEISSNHLPEFYRGFLKWKMMESIEILTPKFDRMKIWSFIGPTGVGKTTTLVKLAARLSLTLTSKITVITIDTYRIGAIEQLKTYTDILRIPLEIAHHPEELKKIIKKWDGQDLLMIDTPGRSPNKQEEIAELKSFLTVHPNIENHLVLSTTTKEKDLDRIIERFSVIPIISFIFTKIDETDHFIPMFNQIFHHKRPIAYMTNGQRVPEDIELATKSKVANLIINSIQWN